MFWVNRLAMSPLFPSLGVLVFSTVMGLVPPNFAIGAYSIESWLNIILQFMFKCWVNRLGMSPAWPPLLVYGTYCSVKQDEKPTLPVTPNIWCYGEYSVYAHNCSGWILCVIYFFVLENWLQFPHTLKFGYRGVTTVTSTLQPLGYNPSREWLHALCMTVDMLRLRNGRHFADDIFKYIIFNENLRILIKILRKHGAKGLVDNDTALF